MVATIMARSAFISYVFVAFWVSEPLESVLRDIVL